ncbi:MAG TPA: hypothetical protein VIY56_14580, partial [Vicinamibacterales bacterium]
MANEDKSTRYQRGRRRVAVWTVLVDLVVLAAAVWAGVRGHGEAPATSAPAAQQTALFVLAVCIARFLATLPLAYHAEVVLARRYQPAAVSALRWCAAYSRRLIQSTVLATAAALFVQAAAWWAGPLWWAWATGGLA